MREIKFRAWDTGLKVMHNDWFVVTSGGDFHFLYYLCGDHALPGSAVLEESLKQQLDIDAPAVIDFADWSFEQMVLMQYTGLLDKNGKEIYEGDIMRWLNAMQSKEEYAKHPYSFSVVKWGFGRARWEGCWGVEVIGNIYENPELLEKK